MAPQPDPKLPDMSAIAATPEFKAAVATAAAQAVSELAKSGALGTPGDNATQELFSKMALSIAEMSHQGSGRSKPLAPDVMQKRLAAGEKLAALIEEVNREQGDARHARDEKKIIAWTPTYRVTTKIHFGERIIDPFRAAEVKGAQPIPQDIEWTGAPNDGLRPLNPLAERIFALYRESVGLPPKLGSRSGPNGGQVALDMRPYWLTVQGHVVQGAPPARRPVLSPGQDAVRDDQGASDVLPVRVLGTIAQPPQRAGMQAALTPFVR